ncbi:hypothetical protein J8F10_19475 [Gemmata sp. G18]|uniref:Helix-turn-helix domain-containing protein n=1 Tax=Gemmata palustris TaxID=2822762 RepID=A0ABS5BX43_9BACT|nr:hypothetical protein [Gemmata palustris]MBP3957433.1 hypothetical protein [Gemmata palustris]
MAIGKETFQILNCARLASITRGEEDKSDLSACDRLVLGTLSARSIPTLAALARAVNYDWSTVRSSLKKLAAAGAVEDLKVICLPTEVSTDRAGRPRCVPVPALVQDNAKLSPKANRLLWLIVSLSTKEGYSWATKKALQGMLSTSAVSLREAKSELESLNLIRDNMGDLEPQEEIIMAISDTWESRIEGMSPTELAKRVRWIKSFLEFAGERNPSTKLAIEIIKNQPSRREFQTEVQFATRFGWVLIKAAKKALKEERSVAAAVLGRLKRIDRYDWQADAKHRPTNITPLEVLAEVTPQHSQDWHRADKAYWAKQVALEQAEIAECRMPKPVEPIVRPYRWTRDKWDAVFTAVFTALNERPFNTTDSVVWYLAHPSIRMNQIATNKAITHLRQKGFTVTDDDIAEAQRQDVWMLWDECNHKVNPHTMRK